MNVTQPPKVPAFVQDLMQIAQQDHPPHELLPQLLDKVHHLWQAIVQSKVTDPTVDCGAGCAACCALPVQCLPDQVFHLAHVIKHRWTPDRIDARIAPLNQAAAYWVGLSADERVLGRLPCPFLDDQHHCQAYEARPLSCRAFTSQDRQQCHDLVASRQTPGAAIPQNQYHFTLYEIATTVLAAANQQKGRSDRQVFFIPALAKALQDPGLEQQ